MGGTREGPGRREPLIMCRHGSVVNGPRDPWDDPSVTPPGNPAQAAMDEGLSKP